MIRRAIGCPLQPVDECLEGVGEVRLHREALIWLQRALQLRQVPERFKCLNGVLYRDLDIVDRGNCKSLCRLNFSCEFQNFRHDRLRDNVGHPDDI